MTVKNTFEYFTLERKLLMYQLEKEIELEVLQEEFKKIEKKHENKDFPRIQLSFKQVLLLYAFLTVFLIAYLLLSYYNPAFIVSIIEAPMLKPIILAVPPFLLALLHKKQTRSK